MTSIESRGDTDSTGVPPHLRNLHLRTYPMRTLGMGLAVLPVLVVLHELDAGWPAWAWTLFCGLAWPHVALLRAKASRTPYRAELTNFMIDSAMAGSLARKKLIPVSSGTLATDTGTFAFLLAAVVLIVGALEYFPALALGPIVEHFQMTGGRLF